MDPARHHRDFTNTELFTHPHRALVPGNPVALSEGAIVYGFEQVCFARAICAEKEIHSFVRKECHLPVIPEITQCDILDDH